MPSLNWLGKDKVLNHHLEVPFRTLKQISSFGDTEVASRNKIIHGDNLLALKALLPEFEGRIRCIYIDPPYNTGNEAWTYNDNVSDPRMLRWLGQVVGREGEDLTRHDKWPCMMYPRLKLLRQLLSEYGSIWISIDDNELASLTVVMNEIFGGANFVATVQKLKLGQAWEKKAGQSFKYFMVFQSIQVEGAFAKNQFAATASRL